MTQADPSQPTPSRNIRTIALVALAIVAVAAGLSIGRVFFVPIVFAVVLNVALGPLVRLLHRLRVPTPIAAALVVGGLMLVLALVIYALAGPMKDFINNAPRRIEKASKKLDPVRQPLKQLSDAASHVKDVGGTSQGSTTMPSETTVKPSAPEPEVATALGTTSRIVGEVLEVFVLLYLLLAAGDLFRDKMVKLIPQARDKAKAVGAVREVEHVVLRYLLVTALINLGQAVAVGLVLWGIGMPMPIFWAAATFVLEFVPYLGAAVLITMLSIISFAEFDSLARGIAAPASYLLISTIQNNLVSPYAYGKNLKLNPVAVFVGVIMWWFLWDVPGAFLAVPIVATLKVMADRTAGLKAVGEFLGE